MKVKIISGVLLGVLAAYFVVHMLQSKTEEKQDERAAHLGVAVPQMTPDYVIAHCGKPAEDKIEGSVRRMQFPPFVTFEFMKTDSGWGPAEARNFPGLDSMSNEFLADKLPCLGLPK